MRNFALLLTVLAISLQSVWAQTKEITGVVTSAEDGSSIPGVSVSVKGTTLGTITDIDGKYTLNVPQSASTLVFSFVGMKTQEKAITGSSINVSMKSDNVAVGEVLVVAYGTSTKESFTGSAGVMKSDKLEKRQTTDVTSALAGAVAGVQVLNNNGQPGEASKLRIRGVGSINSGTDPLYVVDGVPFDGDLSSINPSDIKSVTVLKDAASTALYGARGANGIVMITTKKGASGKTRVSLDMKLGVNSRGVKNYDVLTSPAAYTETAYSAIYNAGIYNLNLSAADANARANQVITTNSNGGYGYQIYTVPNGESLIGMDGKLNPNASLGYSDGTYYYQPDNWANETFQNNLRQEYNLSVSGGDQKKSYYLSFGYLDNKGVISNSGFKRLSGRFRGDNKVTDWLKMGANINYNNIKSNYPGDQDASATNSSANAFFISNFIAPVYPLYVRDASSHAIMTNNGRKVYDYGDGVSTNYSRSFMSIANPAGDLIYNKRDYLMDIMNSSWYAEFTPMRGLDIKAQYGLDVENIRRNELGNAYMGQSASYGGTAYQRQTRKMGFDQQYVANYQVTLNDVHQLAITAGYDGYSYVEEYLDANGQNLYNPESYYLSNVIDNITAGGQKDKYATEGIFGRVKYSYADRYFMNVTYRRDASSRFSPDNRWGNFWSASAAWMISSESFMSNMHWVNMLKLKASYGEQGNDDIRSGADKNYYPWQDQYSVTGANGVFSDAALYYKGNPNLTWETSKSYNVGVDFALYNNSLSGSVEYFGRKSSNMLYNKPTTKTVGYPSIPVNLGSMTNSGVEVDLNATILKIGHLNWTANANATFIKNKINSLPQGSYTDGSRIYEEGKSMYRLYLVDYAGVDPQTGLAQYWTEDNNGKRVKTTDYSAATDYKVATSDLLAKVYGGFGTTVNFYGFDASIQCSYQLGGKIYDSGYRRLMHGGSSSFAGNNWSTDIEKAWTPDNTNTDVPRLDANDKYANSASTRWITSSDYLSVNNITFGYTVPSRLIKEIGLSKVRVYFAADNVALLSKRKGLDPRQSFTSATTALYTPIRTVSGGLNVTF